MKILQSPNFQQSIELRPACYYNVVIKNQMAFRNELTQLSNQLLSNDEHLRYWVDDEPQELSPIGFLVDNPLKIDFDQKKIDALIQKDIQKRMKDEEKGKFADLLTKINEYVEEISFDYDIPLTFNADISVSSFLKAISLTSSSDYENYFSYLLSTIRKISFVLGYRIFFFLNLRDYLTPHEMAKFVHSLRQCEIDFVLISSHRPAEQLSDEIIIELDEDLAELRIDPKAPSP